jgi:hypothetical protein
VQFGLAKSFLHVKKDLRVLNIAVRSEAGFSLFGLCRKLERPLYCTAIAQNLRGFRKFSGDLEYSNMGIDSRKGAKHAKFGGKR